MMRRTYRYLATRPAIWMACAGLAVKACGAQICNDNPKKRVGPGSLVGPYIYAVSTAVAVNSTSTLYVPGVLVLKVKLSAVGSVVREIGRFETSVWNGS